MIIKAVFVDLGGVLISTNPEARKKYESLGITRQKSSQIFKYLQTTNRTEAEINRCLSEEGMTRELWDNFCQEVFFSSEERNDVLYDILRAAKRNGTIIVYTTNNSSTLKEIMEKYKITDLPDLVMNSSEIGTTKPDDEYWKRSLLESQKIKPDLIPTDILVIDDSEINCAYAIKNGMNALVYKNPESNQELCEILKITR